MPNEFKSFDASKGKKTLRFLNNLKSDVSLPKIDVSSAVILSNTTPLGNSRPQKSDRTSMHTPKVFNKKKSIGLTTPKPPTTLTIDRDFNTLQLL